MSNLEIGVYAFVVPFGIAMVVMLFKWTLAAIRKSKPSSVVSAISSAFSKIVSWLSGETWLLVLTTIIGLSAINWFLYWHVESARPFFDSTEGRIHLLSYYILGVASTIVLTNISGWKRITWIILFGFAFWGMGTKSLELTRGKLLAELTGGVIGGPRTSTPTRHASGMPVTCIRDAKASLDIRDTPVLLPMYCNMSFEFDGGTLRVYGQPGMRSVDVTPGVKASWPAGFEARAVSAAYAGEVVRFRATFSPKTASR